MAIIYKITGDCTNCKSKHTYGNIGIQKNILTQGCKNCSYIHQITLPSLNKKIIYLDQSFLSHSFRKFEEQYVKKSDLLIQLASKQLIICPFSDIHEMESNLWKHDEMENLLSFIKRTARGHDFLNSHEVKVRQMIKTFQSFINGESTKYHFDNIDAFDNEIHEWDDYLWIDLSYQYSSREIDEIQQKKKEMVTAFINEFVNWRKHNSSFDEDYQAEISKIARVLFDSLIQLIISILYGHVGSLYSPANGLLLWNLLQIDMDKISDEQRAKRLIKFLMSEHFANTPFVKIKAYMCAMIKRKAKKNHNWLNNKSKAKRALSGIYFDIEHISVYAPYCDAIFVDKMMRDWLIDFQKSKYCNNIYKFKIFSASNWKDFENYLGDISSQKPLELDKYLNLIYGKIIY